jgi:CDP-diacylglycerol--serine O-phosphatidyltransferase
MAHERLTPRQWASERLERLEDLSISKIVPSALTLLGLCFGATSIVLVQMQDWKAAVTAIFCAMLCDMLDGRAARWLGADSRFGVQLDSLADLVSFGVAPAVLVYTWSLSQMGAAGWIAALIFCVCSAIRLARFNVETARDEGATQSCPYFVGLPTPAAAGIMLLPLLLAFEFNSALVRNAWISMALIAFTSVLMVSRTPTPSLKFIRFNRDGWFPAVVLVGMAPLAIYLPWATLGLGLLIYVATIPFVINRSHVQESIEPVTTPAPILSEDAPVMRP